MRGPESNPAARKRLMMVVVTVAAIALLLYLVRGALFPFILGGALAYLLHPVVQLIEGWMPLRDRWPGAARVISILLIYVATVGVLIAALAAIIPTAVDEGRDFVDSIPELYDEAADTLDRWIGEYTERVPADVRTEIESALEGGSSILIGVAKSILSGTVKSVANTLTTIIGLAVVPFFLFYLLKDREATVAGFYSLLPEAGQHHAKNIIEIANGVLGSYIRAQLTLGVIVGVLVYVGLLILGVKYAVLLAIIAGVTELIPVVGPLLGAIPGILVVLATSPGDLVPVLILYLGIQLIENALLVPRIQGNAVGMHPALIMVLLVVASEVAGLWGVILVVPLAAMLRDVFRYFYQEWSVVPEPEPLPESHESQEDPPQSAAALKGREEVECEE